MTTTENTDMRTVLDDLYAAFARGDIPTVLAGFDPEIIWTETAGGPLAGIYTGPHAVLENVFGVLASDWDGFAAIPDLTVCDGDHAVVIGTYHARHRSTGHTLEARFAHSWRIRGERLAEYEQITDTARWNDAAT